VSTDAGEPAFFHIAAGRAERLDRPPDALPADGFLWMTATAGTGRAWTDHVRTLCDVPVFDNHLSDTENEAHPPYFESTSRYEMLVLRALHDGDVAGAISRVRTQAVVCLVFDRCLVTIAPAGTGLLEPILARLLTGASSRLPADADELLLRIADAVVNGYLALRQPLSDQSEQWQAQLLGPGRAPLDWTELLATRLWLQRTGIVCEGQSDAIAGWLDERMAATPVGLDERLQVRANDVLEHLQRVIVLIRRIEAAIESAVQLHFSATAHRTNEIMRVLTVLTAIFLPLTLITGIFGMNFEKMPGIGQSAGFWWTIAGMVAVAVALLVLFRRRRYLERARGPR
jgi:Mg2+ and Co2+ transporter CorA